MARLWPRSLFGRLLGFATLTTLAALLFAGVSIGHVLERFVSRGLDQQLDAQVLILASAVRADGSLDRAHAISLPAFRTGTGWAWRVSGPHGVVTNGAAIETPPPPPGRDRPARPERRHADHDPRPPRDRDPHPGPLRRRIVATPAGPVTIVASGPHRLALEALREAMVPLLLSLSLLGAGLALAALVQLHLGLRPLRTLRAALAEVRAGRLHHVPADQPREIAPLAAELNALIDQNEASLAYARRHVSNLAHGLKTPLAALGLKLAESGGDADGVLAGMVAQIDARIRHHLGRARAAAPGASRRVRTPLAPAIADLVAVMARVHVDRSIRAEIRVADDLAVAIDRQDLDELLGNLFDNAWRHAGSLVRIAANGAGALIAVTVEDDGPGLSDHALREALVPGRRLDERGDGHGFGLSIAEELAELNGGSLTLARSPALGGLCATITLPANLAA